MKNHIWVLLLFPFALAAQNFTPGTSYFDANNYVEYIAGNLPIVISVPHGGYLEPLSIPDRNCNGCTYVRDAYTQELANEIKAAFFQTTGCYPHIIINLLHRKKFDANRDIADAADGNPTVEQSWQAYHDFLDTAKATITSQYSRGLFLDLHGHGHTIQRIELGYLLSQAELQLSDAALNTNAYISQSGIRQLVNDNLQNYTHAELLRGNASLGTLLSHQNFPCVPSTAIPYPLSSEPYFTGGYNTQRHSSLNGGTIDGIQMECNQAIRFDAALRKAFADSLTISLIDYIDIHYNHQFEGNYCGLISKTKHLETKYHFNIFPNPVCEMLLIDSKINDFEVWIYNNLGQHLKTYSYRGLPLNVVNLENGIYFLLYKKEGKTMGNDVLLKNCND